MESRKKNMDGDQQDGTEPHKHEGGLQLDQHANKLVKRVHRA